MKFSDLPKYWNAEKQMVNSLEDVLKEHVPEKVLNEVRTMLYGVDTPALEISEESKKLHPKINLKLLDIKSLVLLNRIESQELLE